MDSNLLLIDLLGMALNSLAADELDKVEKRTDLAKVREARIWRKS